MAILPTTKPKSPAATTSGRNNRRSTVPSTIRRLSKIGLSQYGDSRAFFTARNPEYISRAKGWGYYGKVDEVQVLSDEAELLVAMTDENGNDTFVIVNPFVTSTGHSVEDVMDALNSGKVDGIYCVGAVTVRIHNADKEDQFVNTGVASDILMVDGHIRLRGATLAPKADDAPEMDDDDDIEESLG